MGDIKGFIKYERQDFGKHPVADRIKHWNEFVEHLREEEMSLQGARCMECGIPFCHWGCPIGNLIPEWNDLVYHGQWEEAIKRLHATNNFPEVTGRVCPAPCECSCVMTINQPAVTIKNIELSIIEKAFREGWIKPQPPKTRTGKTVAIIGSGPAGLSCADQLNKDGHNVTVFEKNEVVGGLMTLGIPNYKLEKQLIKRRVRIMEKEGVVFKTGVHVGKSVSIKKLIKKYDAVVLAGGAEQPRDLDVAGRDLEGIYFAVDFLSQQTRRIMRIPLNEKKSITAKGKDVLVIGGGDTGSDCIGTSIRQGAKSVVQIELLSEPPSERALDNPWPEWANVRRISTSQEEGAQTHYAVLTKRLSGQNGKVKKLHAVRLEWGEKDPKTNRRSMKEIPGSEFELDCDLVLLAMGFLGPVQKGMLQDLKVDLDARGNVKTDEDYMTSLPGVFAAGDMRRGQSLVVWAINEGRSAAEGVHKWLQLKK